MIGKAILDELFNYLPARCDSIYVAGGAVVDITEASDIDLWFGKDRRDIADQFVANVPKGMWIPAKSKAVGYDNELVAEAYFAYPISMIVQVMVTPHTAFERMNTFDISTHRWAYTSKGNLIEGAEATTQFEAPKVLIPNKKSFSRYIKICHRYGHPVLPEVLLSIIGDTSCS